MVALAIAAALAVADPRPADHMIDVAGGSLHIVCSGDRQPGTPLVVLEAGATAAPPHRISDRVCWTSATTGHIM